MRPNISTSLLALTALVLPAACTQDAGRASDAHDRDGGSCEENTCVEPEAGRLSAIALGDRHEGAFEVTWTLTAGEGPHPGGAGLSDGAGEGFDDLGPILRLAQGGLFDARDGDVYRADAALEWDFTETYEVRMVVDVARHRYDVFVTDPEGEQTQIADDFAFRSSQSDVGGLDHLTAWSGADGALRTCGAEVTTIEPEPVVEGGDAIRVPPVTGVVRNANANKGSIESTIAAARPGDRVTIPSGTYSSVTFDFERGQTGADPIVVVPADPNDPPLFTGRNEATGDHFMLMGLRFDADGTGSSGRMLKMHGSEAATLAHLEFDKTDNIAIELASGVTDLVVHRCLFQGTGDSQTGNGGEAIKAGVSSTAGVQRGNRVEKSRFEDIRDERETISGKEGGLTLFQLTFDNTTDIVARHASNMRVEECTGVRNITLTGPDHVVVNSQVHNDIEVWSGSHDGSVGYGALPSGTGSVYLSAHDTRIEHSVGELRIGEDSYAGGSVRAEGTKVADHASAPKTFNGASFDEVAAQSEAREPRVIHVADTGLTAYQTLAL